MKTLTSRSLRTVCLEVFVLISTSFVMSLAFPGFLFPHGLGFISLFALIPVFMTIRNTSWPWVGLYGFIYGFFFYLFFNYWLKAFHPGAILLVPVIKGGEMVLLFLALKAADRFFGRKAYVADALIWVAYAYLSESWFAGYPYGTVCYALYKYLPLIQIADITGIAGIIFLQVLPQAFIGIWLIDKLRGEADPFSKYLKKNAIEMGIYLMLAVSSLVYGFVKTGEWKNREEDRTWAVAAVQHNHDSWKGGVTTYRKNFNNLRRYTLQAMTEDPDIVIWSETAFVPSIDWNREFSYDGNQEMRKLVDEFVAFGNELGTPLLTGNADGAPIVEGGPAILEDGSLNRKDYNSVILFQNGGVEEKYRKQHLVPFTEHFPYKKQLPWLYDLLVSLDYNWWEYGTRKVVFESDGVHFSTPICFEDVFGYLPAEFVKEGADVIVNMTNDNWSKSEVAARQHLDIALFRSIETRKSTVRGTNSGITCMITPDGRIHDEMPVFTVGYHIYDVPVYTHESNANTFYVEHIDLFSHISVWLSGILLVAGGAMTLFRRFGKKEKKEVK